MHSRSNTIRVKSEVTPLLQSSTTVFNFEAKNHTSPTTHSCVEQNLYKFICNKTLTQVEGRDKGNYNWLSGKLIPELELSLAYFKKHAKDNSIVFQSVSSAEMGGL